jgi:tetratricopeptide (TPR) repeat protein
MATRLPLVLSLGRRGWLVILLIALLAVLALSAGELRFAYRMQAAHWALRDRDFASAVNLLESVRPRGLHRGRWHFLLARAQRRGGDARGAADSLDRAEQRGWPAEQIALQRLLLAAQSGRINTVQTELAGVLGSDHDDDTAEEIYEAMARGYLSTYQFDEATRCLHSWSQWQPDNQRPHLWLADLHLLVDDNQQAAAGYREVLRIKPDHLDAQLKLARALASLTHLDEAAQLLEECLQRSPDNHDALLSLAEIRRRQGTTEQARSLLYDALLLDPTFDRRAAILGEIGKIAQEEQRYLPALAALEQSVQANPNLISSRQALAAVLMALGQPQAAERQRQAVGELRTRKQRLNEAMQNAMNDSRSSADRRTAGLILLEDGRLAEAAEWLRSAIELEPEDAAAHAGLARYYELVGEAEHARRHDRAAGQFAESESPPAPGR